MALTEAEKQKIREEEKYRQAVVKSISGKKSKSAQKHGVPLLLSIFIPGLGQFVKGEVKKGLIIFFIPIIGFVVLGLLSLVDRGSVMGGFSSLWFGWIILYIWQLIDAYNN